MSLDGQEREVQAKARAQAYKSLLEEGNIDTVMIRDPFFDGFDAGWRAALAMLVQSEITPLYLTDQPGGRRAVEHGCTCPADRERLERIRGIAEAALAAREEPQGHLAEECCPDECPACADETACYVGRTSSDDLADLQACAEEVRDVLVRDTERPDATDDIEINEMALDRLREAEQREQRLREEAEGTYELLAHFRDDRMRLTQALRGMIAVTESPGTREEVAPQMERAKTFARVALGELRDTERPDGQTTHALAVEALDEIGLVRVEIDLAESPYLLAVSQARNLGELLIEAADKLTHTEQL